MARYERYLRIDNAIKASDNGGIWQRWRYGRRIVCDYEASTPRGYLKHGKLEWFIQRSGVSAREIQWRMQAAKAYPKESQIRAACTHFATWWDLTHSGFPPFEGDPDERPYNPLETDELERQHAAETDRRGEEALYDDGYGALIPRDAFPDSTPLPEIDRYADQELELAARHTDAAQRLRFYVDSLKKAVPDWQNATLGEAERAFHDRDD
jgi:hypothetical protein